MIEDWIGKLGWPVAFALAALFVSIAWYNVSHDNNETRMKTACIMAHGSLGEHDGWPTCTPTSSP